MDYIKSFLQTFKISLTACLVLLLSVGYSQSPELQKLLLDIDSADFIDNLQPDDNIRNELATNIGGIGSFFRKLASSKNHNRYRADFIQYRGSTAIHKNIVDVYLSQEGGIYPMELFDRLRYHFRDTMNFNYLVGHSDLLPRNKKGNLKKGSSGIRGGNAANLHELLTELTDSSKHPEISTDIKWLSSTLYNYNPGSGTQFSVSDLYNHVTYAKIQEIDRIFKKDTTVNKVLFFVHGHGMHPLLSDKQSEALLKVMRKDKDTLSHYLDSTLLIRVYWDGYLVKKGAHPEYLLNADDIEMGRNPKNRPLAGAKSWGYIHANASRAGIAVRPIVNWLLENRKYHVSMIGQSAGCHLISSVFVNNSTYWLEYERGGITESQKYLQLMTDRRDSTVHERCRFAGDVLKLSRTYKPDKFILWKGNKERLDFGMPNANNKVNLFLNIPATGSHYWGEVKPNPKFYTTGLVLQEHEKMNAKHRKKRINYEKNKLKRSKYMYQVNWDKYIAMTPESDISFQRPEKKLGGDSVTYMSKTKFFKKVLADTYSHPKIQSTYSLGDKRFFSDTLIFNIVIGYNANDPTVNKILKFGVNLGGYSYGSTALACVKSDFHMLNQIHGAANDKMKRTSNGSKVTLVDYAPIIYDKETTFKYKGEEVTRTVWSDAMWTRDPEKYNKSFQHNYFWHIDQDAYREGLMQLIK